MNIITNVLEAIALFCISVISSLGYFGVFFLMMLESMIFPVPSELVMPFAGFLITTGEMSFLWIVIFSTLGSIVGSLISYYIGRYGGIKFVNKYGNYFLLNKEHLISTEKWFSKKGDLTILIGRFVPIVRHIISIPAGMGKMNIKKFILYTAIGAGLWNFFLAYVGFVLGKNWETISKYSDYLSFAVLAVIILFVGYFLYREIIKKRIKKNR